MHGKGSNSKGLIVKVAVDIVTGKEYDYLVPPEWSPIVVPGVRVRVPFGKREVLGYVTRIIDEPEHPNPKPIIKVIGRRALIPPKVLELARWISSYYCAPFEMALKTVLPVSVRREDADFVRRLFVEVDPQSPTDLTSLTPRQREIFHIVEERRRIRLQELLQLTRCTRETVRRLEKKGFVRLTFDIVERDPFFGHDVVPTDPLPLNAEQKQALDAICAALDQVQPGPLDSPGPVFLLHGVTGSGKTEVYLQAIAYCLRKGRGAIVLVPEISLTPQTIERFRSRFCHGPYRTEIAVLHSHLSHGERHDQWHRIRSGVARIVIGPRSAVFAPVEPLGLIVVDEEHETSYKQAEAPRYHARDVAIVRARQEGAVVVLGSATPSLESYYNARRGKYRLLRLTQRVDNKKMPIIRVVDMRHETRKEKIPVFSRLLTEAILKRLESHEQIILFLNRRGYATTIQCPACGYVASCPHCSIPLTYHKTTKEAVCHFCGHRDPAPSRCPNRSCGSRQILFSGLGTQKVEELLRGLVPKAKIRRLDSDALTKKNEYQEILRAFQKGEIDILVGTQMIAKGLHFPRVTLVGIINADLSLHRPDFRGAERTFQLLTQVSGRAGRGDIEGEVIIQSFTPFHPAIQYARRHDCDSFYEQELAFRQELDYPPFRRLALVLLESHNDEKAQYLLSQLRQFLERRLEASDDVIISGPAPAPVFRLRDYYRYQLLLRTRRMANLANKLAELLKEYELPPDCKITVDIDPVDLC